MPELLSYWLDVKQCVQMARFVNDSVASMVSNAPADFYGLGMVPLQDVDAAIAELDRLMHVVGLVGVEIGSNVQGVPVGDPLLRPFFSAAEDWGAAVFVHPLRALGRERLVGPTSLEAAVAFPGEIGYAAASLVTGDLLAECPDLRIGVSHGGGSLQMIVPRLQRLWEAQPRLQDLLTLPPQTAARKLFYDDLLYEPSLIASAMEVFGPTQLMVGSDYPFAIMDADPVGRVRHLDLPADVEAGLVAHNARRWLAARAVPSFALGV